MSVRDGARSIDRSAVVLYAVLLAYVLNLIARTASFGDSRAELFPYMFGIPAALLLGTLVFRGLMPVRFDDLVPTRSVDDTDESDGPDDGGELGAETIALFASFPVAAYLLGFTLVVPAYVFSLTFAVRRNLRESAAVTALVSACWWLIFVEGLNVIFHEGVLF